MSYYTSNPFLESPGVLQALLGLDANTEPGTGGCKLWKKINALKRANYAANREANLAKRRAKRAA